MSQAELVLMPAPSIAETSAPVELKLSVLTNPRIGDQGLVGQVGQGRRLASRALVAKSFRPAEVMHERWRGPERSAETCRSFLLFRLDEAASPRDGGAASVPCADRAVHG